VGYPFNRFGGWPQKISPAGARRLAIPYSARRRPPPKPHSPPLKHSGLDALTGFPTGASVRRGGQNSEHQFSVCAPIAGYPAKAPR